MKPLSLKPLKITCTSTNCFESLHCFKFKKGQEGEKGSCRDCGVELIDWPRVKKRDFEDVQHTFASLKKELIRHHFWHLVLRSEVVEEARSRGWEGRGRLHGLNRKIPSQLRSSIGPEKPYREGYQTPREYSKDANIIHYAQHATATCCRACLEYWHGIPIGQELLESEIEYLSKLVRLYVRERLPDLMAEGEIISPKPKKS